MGASRKKQWAHDGRGAQDIKKSFMGISRKKTWAASLFSKVHFFAPMILVSLEVSSKQKYVKKYWKLFVLNHLLLVVFSALKVDPQTRYSHLWSCRSLTVLRLRFLPDYFDYNRLPKLLLKNTLYYLPLLNPGDFILMEWWMDGGVKWYFIFFSLRIKGNVKTNIGIT